MNHREIQRRLDRIAASRIGKLNGGIPTHVSLSNANSITLRNKFKRMGLVGDHIDAALTMVDEVGFSKIMENQSLSSRFATIKASRPKPKIYDPNK